MTALLKEVSIMGEWIIGTFKYSNNFIQEAIIATVLLLPLLSRSLLEKRKLVILYSTFMIPFAVMLLEPLQGDMLNLLVAFCSNFASKPTIPWYNIFFTGTIVYYPYFLALNTCSDGTCVTLVTYVLGILSTTIYLFLIKKYYEDKLTFLSLATLIANYPVLNLLPRSVSSLIVPLLILSLLERGLLFVSLIVITLVSFIHPMLWYVFLSLSFWLYLLGDVRRAKILLFMSLPLMIMFLFYASPAIFSNADYLFYLLSGDPDIKVLKTLLNPTVTFEYSLAAWFRRLGLLAGMSLLILPLFIKNILKDEKSLNVKKILHVIVSERRELMLFVSIVVL